MSPIDGSIDINEWMGNADMFTVIIIICDDLLLCILYIFFLSKYKTFYPLPLTVMENPEHTFFLQSLCPRVRACPSYLLNHLHMCRCRWQEVLFQCLRIVCSIENWGCYQCRYALGIIASDFVSLAWSLVQMILLILTWDLVINFLYTCKSLIAFLKVTVALFFMLISTE